MKIKTEQNPKLSMKLREKKGYFIEIKMKIKIVEIIYYILKGGGTLNY